jgi:hypothetical protein
LVASPDKKIMELLKKDAISKDIYGEFSHQSVNIPMFEEIIPEKPFEKNENGIEAFSMLKEEPRHNNMPQEDSKKEESEYRKRIEENNKMIMQNLNTITANQHATMQSFQQIQNNPKMEPGRDKIQIQPPH